MTDQKPKNSPVSTTESSSCGGFAMALAMALRRIFQWLCYLATLQWPILPSWNGSAKNVNKNSAAQRTSSIGQDPTTCHDSTTGYECSICLEKTSLKEKVSLNCSHVFHVDCLLTWMIQDGSCPVCREEYDVTSKFDEINTKIANPGINMRLHNGCIDVSHDNGTFMRLYNVNIDERMFKDTFNNPNNGGIDIKLNDGGFIKINNSTGWYDESGFLRINDGTIDMKLMNVAINHLRRDGEDVRVSLDNGSFINLKKITITVVEEADQ